ncbi:MAG: NAD(P)-dependent oxidoreductase [Cytophagales bacterium]|nr:NAD(P)-dependent oxidoreductase [Cytophagales bacterium]
MKKIKIGIIRETKIPPERRTPLTPKNCLTLMKKFPEIEIVVQPSKIRIVLDEEYKANKIPLQEDLDDCDYLFGLKEIPPGDMIENKTYFIFSHTIKKQPENKRMLKAMAQKHISLIDYECIKNKKGERTISFGHFAGMVGAYNAIKTYGHKWHLFVMKPAHQCINLKEFKAWQRRISLPPLKIILTGGGRVAGGAAKVLDYMHITEVSPNDFIKNKYDKPVYCRLHSADYYHKQNHHIFDKSEFYTSPAAYVSHFMNYAVHADMLISCHYWNPGAPPLFTKQDAKSPDFHIKVIADITCDVNGSIPVTLRSTSIDNPVYDYNPDTMDLEVPYNKPDNITVMAIDNLPCELARDASEDFGLQLIKHLIPELYKKNKSKLLSQATILNSGVLTDRYAYLNDYINM